MRLRLVDWSWSWSWSWSRNKSRIRTKSRSGRELNASGGSSGRCSAGMDWRGVVHRRAASTAWRYVNIWEVVIGELCAYLCGPLFVSLRGLGHLRLPIFRLGRRWVGLCVSTFRLFLLFPVLLSFIFFCFFAAIIVSFYCTSLPF